MEETVIDSLKAIIENQKIEISFLEYKVKRFETMQKEKCMESVMKDDYFKGLSFESIAQLAKKSIRLTDDNNRLRHKLEDIEEITDDKKILEIIERTD